MNAAAYALEVDHRTEHNGLAERALWCAALALMLEDARRYHRNGKDPLGVEEGTGRKALRDVRECGPMVRHLCEMADQDAAWLCAKFCHSLSVEPIESIEQKPGDGLSDGNNHR